MQAKGRELSASRLNVLVKLIDGAASLPKRAREFDAGFDLSTREQVSLTPGSRAAAATGVSLQLPESSFALVMPRSGLAIDKGITLLNAPGLIDAGYRGEIKVILVNHSDSTVEFQPGDRIAQLLVLSMAKVNFVEVDQLASSERGEGGFGHSGTHPL